MGLSLSPLPIFRRPCQCAFFDIPPHFMTRNLRVVGLTPKRSVVLVRWVQRGGIDAERLGGVPDFTHQMRGRRIVYVFRLGKGVGRPMIRTSVTDGGWEGRVY